jgi:hypothetical protein
MLSRLKQYLIIGLIIAGFYFILSHHFIFTGSFTSFDLLKKSKLTLNDTFYSLKQATPEDALSISDLRQDGIGDLMVKKGIISEERLDQLMQKYDN